ncbi:MAG: chalcone isomerase family protein [Noviherbaspirillum sp.]
MLRIIPDKKLLVSLAVAWLVGTASAHAATVGGYVFDETARTGSQELKLNGAGMRYKMIFSVYSAGLYLGEKRKSPAEVYAVPGAKRMRLVMQRTVNAEEFGQAFLTGIQQNSDKAERSRLIEELAKFGQLFATVPELKKGDVLNIDFIPGRGTVIQINGKQVAESLFYTMLLKIWLGDKPADAKLKNALLGEDAAS